MSGAGGAAALPSDDDAPLGRPCGLNSSPSCNEVDNDDDASSVEEELQDSSTASFAYAKTFPTFQDLSSSVAAFVPELHILSLSATTAGLELHLSCPQIG